MDLGTALAIAFTAIACIGALLTALALLAVRRSPSPRMALVASGFLLITLQGIAVDLGLLTVGWSASELLLVSALFEAVLLGVLFIATLVR